jgi:hypothetical protein
MQFPKAKRKIPKKLFFVGFILILLLCIGSYVFIYKSEPRLATVNIPKQQPVAVGQKVTIPILIDTVEDTMNAAEVYITFDPEVMKVEEVTRDGSIFKIWITDMPSFSNEEGKINFAGGLPKPGFKGTGQIGTVTLTLLQKQDAVLTFTEKTRILKNDGQGTFVPLRLNPVTIQAK